MDGAYGTCGEEVSLHQACACGISRKYAALKTSAYMDDNHKTDLK